MNGKIEVVNNFIFDKVSCLCVSRNRTFFLKKAIEMFLSQSYPNKEMIIVYYSNDLATKNMALSNKLDNVFFFEYDASENKTLGEIRNLSIELSTGKYICIFDDDDFHPPNRITKQIFYLREYNKKALTLSTLNIYNCLEDKNYISKSRRTMGWEGSLLCERDIALKLAYDHENCGEDTGLLIRLNQEGELCIHSTKEVLYCYFFHTFNTQTSDHFKTLIDVEFKFHKNDMNHNLLEKHINWFKNEIIALNKYMETEKVSCICVTRNRVDHLKNAIDCFKKQTHKNKELVIIYYSDDLSTKELIKSIDLSDISAYEYDISENKTLGELRNMAINLSNGNFICIFDDDDIHAENRIEKQLFACMRTQKKACAIRQIILNDIPSGKKYKTFYRYEGWEPTLLCKKSHMPKYLNKPIQEDGDIIQILSDHMITIDDLSLYTYNFHGSNISGKKHFEEIVNKGQEIDNS